MALDTPLKPHFNPGIVANLSNSGSALNTLLVGVCNLHGGHQLIQREGKASDIKQWWRTSEHLVDVPRTFEDQVTQYKSLFFDACRIRMRSDVPIGTSLSGGLDSSSILCTMTKVKSDANSGQRTADKWQLAFMIDYVGTSTSERGFAEKVIKHTGAMPCYKDICSSSVSPDEIVQTIYHLEAIDKLKLGIWNVYKEMRNRDVVVSVDGHGGDETLAGYTRYISVALQDAIWPWKNNRYRDLQDVLRGMGDSNILPSRMKTMMPNARSLKRLVERLLPSNYNRLKTYLNRLQASHDSNWMLALPADSMFLREEQLSGALFDYLNTMLYYDTHNYSLTKYLRDYDRLSMAHGVEIRTPFLDWRLVTYAFSLPSSSKLGAGFTKRILRESMRDVLPETIRIRKSKIGFADPVGGWYAHNLKPFFLDTVHSQDFLQSEVWKGPVIRDFVENCYRKEEFGAIGKCWRYIQAMHLMRSFQQSSTRNRAV